MSRTKLRQGVQVSNSEVYNDAYAGAHTGSTAEPALIETLEYDLNNLRTQFKQLKGDHLASWYTSAPDGYTLSDLFDGYTSLHGVSQLELGSLGSMIDSTGAWFGFSGTNYLDATLTTTFAITELDTQVKVAHDGYVAAAAAAASAQAELDTVEAATGLNTNGTFLAHSGSNYIDTATTMFQVDSMLDAQVKIAHDGYVSAQAELDTLETALGTGINANGTYNNGAFTGSNYLDGYSSFTEDLLALDAAITAAASGATLQSAYNNAISPSPDIQVANNDNLDIRLGTGSSAFTVQSNDGTQTLKVTDGYVLIDGYLSITGSTLEINTVVTDADHWLLSPGLSSTVALEIMPSISAGLYTADLMQVYDGYNGTLVMNINEAGTATFNEQLVANGTFKYTNSPTSGYFLTTDASGNATWADVTSGIAGDGLSSSAGQLNVNIVPGETIIDTDRVGIDEAFSKTDFTSFVVSSSGTTSLSAAGPSNILTLSADGAVNVNAGESSLWNQSSGDFNLLLNTGNLSATAGTSSITMNNSNNIAIASTGPSSWTNTAGDLTLSTVTSGNVTVQTAGTGDAIFMTTSGVGGGMTLTTNGSADNSNPSSVSVSQTGGFDTFGVNNNGGISMLQTANVYNGGGAPGQFPNLAMQAVWLSQTLDGNPTYTPMIVGFTVNADDGYTQTTRLDGYHIALSAQQADFGAGMTGGSLLMSGYDGYMQAYAEARFSDARTAPTSAPTLDGVKYFKLSSSSAGGADFSSTLRSAASALGFLSAGATGELGIIDAINTLASSGSSSMEKSIFVIASSDGRLSGGDKILSLNTTGGGPNRGSLELTPSIDGYGPDFRPGRDLEVYVNGTLMLADATQKVSGTAATDDYYLASNDVDKLNFAFALVAGDVVIVKNNKAAPGENVDTNWTLIS